jgi:hypothetical protein
VYLLTFFFNMINRIPGWQCQLPWDFCICYLISPWAGADKALGNPGMRQAWWESLPSLLSSVSRWLKR